VEIKMKNLLAIIINVIKDSKWKYFWEK
jgi:hypothetical protein